jgi:hypothetical protein
MKRFFILFILSAICLNISAQNKIVVRDINGEQELFDTKTVKNITFSNDNLQFVDLDLPSGTKWATCNLGANSPEGFGDFYSWGELSTKTSYTQQNYSYYKNSSYENIGSNIASTDYDVSTKDFGGKWALPTIAQINELINNCTWFWSSYNGVSGYFVEGHNGNKIFLPAAGNFCSSSHDNVGSCGFLWCSEITNDLSKAYYLGFQNGKYSLNNNMRDLGFSVRPVSHSVYAIDKSLSVGKTTGIPLRAIGVEFDPHFFTACLSKNDGAKAEDWDNIIVPRIKKMCPQSFRVWVMPTWFEPQNDNDDPDSTNWAAMNFDTNEMKSLYKLLDLAEKEKIRVTLVLWGATAGSWLAGQQTGNWIFPPANRSEWAENFSALAKYLIENKGYTCIKELTPMNEPSNVMSRTDYIEMCILLDSHLKKFGVRDKLALNLSDNIQDDSYFLQKVSEQVYDIADVFNSHCYSFGYNSTNETIGNWEKRNSDITKNVGRPHFVGEFGSNLTVGSSRQTDIDWFRRGILMDRLALNFLNNGACGVSYWQLFDEWYSSTDSYNSMQQLGMWRYVRTVYSSEPYYDKLTCDYQPRPQYYAYSLLTKYVRPGAEIHPIDTGESYIAGTAFKNVDGKWIYVFANSSLNDYNISLINDNSADGDYKVYRYEVDELPNDDNLLEPLKITIKAAGNAKCEVPSYSVILLSQQ